MAKRILVVDDEKEIADLLEVYLVNEGYEVKKFYNGTDALAYVLEQSVDLAILDVMLPDMDGFALCRAIRENWYLPIIMLTAKVEDSDKIMGLTMGADDYITKPFNPLEVTARVRGQLRRVETYNPALEKHKEEIYDIRGLVLNIDQHTCTLYGKPIELYMDSNNTVMAHIAKIREKLSENARKPKYIKTVWGVGYKIEQS